MAGIGDSEGFLAGLAIALNTTLLVGLLYRQNRGPGNIAFESLVILVLYPAGFLTLTLLM